MSEYIKLIGSVIHVANTISAWRFIFFILTIPLTAILWQLPEILKVLK